MNLWFDVPLVNPDLSDPLFKWLVNSIESWMGSELLDLPAYSWTVVIETYAEIYIYIQYATYYPVYYVPSIPIHTRCCSTAYMLPPYQCSAYPTPTTSFFTLRGRGPKSRSAVPWFFAVAEMFLKFH